MAALFWIIVLMILVLTGAIVPVLIFGGWALVVVLIVVFVALLLFKTIAALLRPIFEVSSDVVKALGPSKFPKPDDPDYRIYLDWANKTGEFARTPEWESVKKILTDRRRQVSSRHELASEKAVNPENRAYIDWANKTGEFAHIEKWESVEAILEARRSKNANRG